MSNKPPKAPVSMVVFNNTNMSNNSVNLMSIELGNDTNAGLLVQGWTAQPAGRGTINIIWDCFTTIFLCCWTVLCVNIPSPHWGRCQRIFNKILLFCIGVLGPEFILGLAVGQWLAAHRSVEDFKRSGYPQWSITHAFLADMGGFVLHPPDWVQFPLNASQVHYLVAEGYIPFSAVGLDEQVIKDKNKGDGMFRIIAVLQIIWFSLNCLGRAIQHLAITTLELTTISFIICTLGTCVFWAHKPMDVGTTIVLRPHTTIADILIKAGDKAKDPYKSTPLDFVFDDKWSWRLYWLYGINILRNMGLVPHSKRRPIDRIPDDNFPPLSRRQSLLVLPFCMIYAAVPICGWNFYFPTQIERTLWRLSSLGMIVCIVVVWIVDQYTVPALTNYANRRPQDVRRITSGDIPRCSGLRKKLQIMANSLRNNSPDHDPSLTVPLKGLIPYAYSASSIPLHED